MAEIEISSETEDLDAEYIAEDPSILSEEQLKSVANKYGLTIEKVKTLAKQMSKARREKASEIEA